MSNALKTSLRNAYRSARELLSPDFQQKASAQICARIQSLEQYRYAKRIALYQACKGEVDLSPIWKSAPRQGKYCYFPALAPDKHLAFLPATPVTPFQTNHHGNLEPKVDLNEAIEINELQIILTPLVVFDNQCNRIGMGGGYYDRSLASAHNPCLLGVAYEFQRHVWLQKDEWDIPLTAVVTEKTVYWRNELQ